jgi:hypothetical protein
MDLRRHLQVLHRFRLLLGGGLLLGLVLAGLALYKPVLSGGVGLEAREKTRYSSSSRVFVTQRGFPWGRIVAGSAPETQDAGAGEAQESSSTDNPPLFGAPSRYADLAIIYSYLIESEDVKKLVASKPPGSEVLATSVKDGTGSKAEALPLIEIQTLATDPNEAEGLNSQVIKALQTYIGRQLEENDVPLKDRVSLQIVSPPEEAIVWEKPAVTPAVVALVLCLLLAVLLAYALENLNPRPGPNYHPGMPEQYADFDDLFDADFEPEAEAVDEADVEPEVEPVDDTSSPPPVEAGTRTRRKST